MFSVRNYIGQNFKSLSVNPLNDIKDMTTMLQLGGFGLGNTYENVPSRQHFEDILKSYVEAVNKEPEDIGNLSQLVRICSLFPSGAIFFLS